MKLAITAPVRSLAGHASLAAVAAALMLCLVSSAAAQGKTAGGSAGVSHTNLAWQIALESVDFSPGLIDGRIGPKTRLATSEFQRVRGLPVTGDLDEATSRVLGVDRLRAQAVRTYIIQEADMAEVGPLPTGWLERSRAKRLPYPSAKEMLAEKFHTSLSTLTALNPGGAAWNRPVLRAGDRVVVPNIIPGPAPSRAKRIEIDLDQKVVRVIGPGDNLTALMHCSIAAKKEKRPSGRARVTVVSFNPTYVFDPAMWPEVKGVDRKLVLPPGPRNPVGLCWIGLSLPGYGLHGTPAPEMIGKTGSHGCFRLTNWDACRLGAMVAPGTPVVFKGGGS